MLIQTLGWQSVFSSSVDSLTSFAHKGTKCIGVAANYRYLKTIQLFKLTITGFNAHETFSGLS